MVKSIFQSKTFWVNGITLVGAGAGWLAGMLTPYPELIAGLVITQAIVNIVLRLVTKVPVKV